MSSTAATDGGGRSADGSRHGRGASSSLKSGAYDANEFWNTVNKVNSGASVFEDSVPAAQDYETVRNARAASKDVLLYIGFYVRRKRSIVRRGLIDGLSMMRRTTEEARVQTLSDIELESTPLFECSARKLTALEPAPVAAVREGAEHWPASAATHTIRSLRSQLFQKGKKAGDVALVPKAELAISDNGADTGRLQWTKADSPASRMVFKTFATDGKEGQVWVAWTLASVTTSSVVQMLHKCAKKWRQAHATHATDQRRLSLLAQQKLQLQGGTPSAQQFVAEATMSKGSARALIEECIKDNMHVLTPVMTPGEKQRERLATLKTSSTAVAETSARPALAPRGGKFWSALFGVAVAVFVVVSGAIAAIVLTVTNAQGRAVVPAGAIALGVVGEGGAPIVDLARGMRGANGYFF